MKQSIETKLPIDDAELADQMKDLPEDPYAVILALVKSLNSEEATALMVESIKNTGKMSGLLAERDTLLFLQPIADELSPEFKVYMENLNLHISELEKEESETIGKFEQLVKELNPNGRSTDTPESSDVSNV